jgi:hypothetical protein
MLSGLFAGLWARIAAVGAVILGVAGALFAVRQSGRKSAQVEQQAEAERARGDMAEARTTAPRTPSEVSERLRQGGPF